jgi:hypothetical protein
MAVLVPLTIRVNSVAMKGKPSTYKCQALCEQAKQEITGATVYCRWSVHRIQGKRAHYFMNATAISSRDNVIFKETLGMLNY